MDTMAFPDSTQDDRQPVRSHQHYPWKIFRPGGRFNRLPTSKRSIIVPHCAPARFLTEASHDDKNFRLLGPVDWEERSAVRGDG